MTKELQGLKVAILVDNGFEQVELTEPQKALEQAGALTHIVSPAGDYVKGWQHKEWGDEFPVDTPLAQADPNAYDALLLPGGVMNPDRLRMDPKAVAFVRAGHPRVQRQTGRFRPYGRADPCLRRRQSGRFSRRGRFARTRRTKHLFFRSGQQQTADYRPEQRKLVLDLERRKVEAHRRKPGKNGQRPFPL